MMHGDVCNFILTKDGQTLALLLRDLLATMTVLESLSSRKGMSPPVTRQVYSPEADIEAAPSSRRLEDSGETL